MEFDQVILPLTRDDFLANYWEKAWLRLPGTPGRFRDLLNWEDLNNLLENHRLAPPQIKLSQDGAAIDPDRYIYTPGGVGHGPRVDLGRLVALLAEGMTLVIHSVEELLPQVRAVSESFRDILSARNYVNLYSSWKSQKGFDLHWDAHEVVVLQLYGRKRWQIFAPTQDYPLDRDAAPKPTGEPVWEGMLEDGDLLYLPRGWWHVAYPVNEPSLHLTFGVAPLHGLNFIAWAMGKLRGNAFLRQDLPILRNSTAKKTHMAKMRMLVTEALSDDAIEEFMREAAERVHGRPRIRLPQAPYEQSAPLQETSFIRLASGHQLSFSNKDDMVTFIAYGKSYSVPSYVMPALALLSDTRSISVGELAQALESNIAVANLKQGLAMLARAGVVLVESA